jgi:hypothetical protein
LVIPLFTGSSEVKGNQKEGNERAKEEREGMWGMYGDSRTEDKCRAVTAMHHAKLSD